MIFFNRYFDKNRLKALVLWGLTRSGEKKTIDLVEKLKDVGFHYATQAGLSLSIDDLKIPPNKAELISEAEKIVQSSQRDYEIGNLTILERFQQMIDIWHRTSELLKQNVIQHFRSRDLLNPVFMMAFSGARGNLSQVRQLVGMRGLMADPQGQILDFPIRSNFREGLTLTEYVISCYGARKGLVDTALRTANSGYLTRRLVDVAQHIMVKLFDCRTTKGILVTDMKDGKKTLLSVQKRIVGRVLAEKIGFLASKNQDISPTLAAKIIKLKNQVVVRSPLTCEAKNSVCQLCYGWSLAHGKLVSLGEAVGILAGQSIGEPGTQLTMRTFHTGGVFSGDVMQEIRSPSKGTILFSRQLQGNLIRTLHGKIAFLTKIEGEFFILNKVDKKNFYQIPVSSILFARHSEYVQEKQLLVEFSSYVTTSNQGIQAKYNLNSKKEGQIYFEDVLLVVKGGKEGDIIKTALNFGSIWILAGKLYESPGQSTLFTKPGDLIDTTSIFNEFILDTPYTGFLDFFPKEKEQEKFVSQKIISEKLSLYTEIQILNQLLIHTRKITTQQKKIATKRIKSQLQLKHPFTYIFFKKIKYKKVGYFISFENLNDLTIFYPNSLAHQLIHNTFFSLQFFENNNLNLSGIVHSYNNQYFLMAQKLYQIPETVFYQNSKNNLKKSFSKKNYTKKEDNFFTIKNLQGNTHKKRSGKNQLIFIKSCISKNKIIEKSCKTFFILNKKVIFFKENPYEKKHSKLKIKGDFLGERKNLTNFYKKNSVPISNLEKKGRSRKTSKKFKFLDVLQKPKFKKKFTLKKENLNFDGVNIKVEKGSMTLLKNNSIFLLSHTPLSKVGDPKNFYYWDQNFYFLKIIEMKAFLKFFEKKKYLKRIRYINNSLIKIDGIHKKNLYSKKLLTKNFRKIFRNKIILQNNFIKTKFILLTKRLKEINYKNRIKKIALLPKKSNNFYLLNFYKNNSFLFNKQKCTRLKGPFKSLAFKITKKTTSPLLNYNRQSFSISLKLPKKNFVKKVKIELLFPQILEISLTQNISTKNSVVPSFFSNEKLVITKQKAIFEQNSLKFNYFSSSFSGEITSIKKYSFGKQKSLLLTKKNQISFFNENKNYFVKIGQVLRYGDKISLTSAVEKSGQIIEMDKNKITLRKAQPILFSSQGVFHIDNGDLVEKDCPLITLFYQKLKTEDIVQGIPKIEELFEARQTKEGEPLQENIHTKMQFFFHFYKQQYPYQEAVRKSIEKIQQNLVNNVQKVYQSQGVTIADKHIEIIVRQMTTKVKITESGRTGLLRGELVNLEKVEQINLGIEARTLDLINLEIETQKKSVQQDFYFETAEYEPIILGITKVALETDSFISASSFQETTRILSRAAIERKTDFLRGLKENVILGQLIPAGTGFRRFLHPQIKLSKNEKNLSWFSYKDIVQIFSRLKK